MQLYDNAPDMAAALRAFEREHWGSLPARVREEIERNSGPGSSFVVLFANTAEAMFADPQGHSNKAKRTLLGQLAYICGLNGWHGFRDGRGLAIQKAMARDNGETPPEGSSWPDASSDPAPDPSFAPAEEPASDSAG
jgi:hypothetical protein